MLAFIFLPFVAFVGYAIAGGTSEMMFGSDKPGFAAFTLFLVAGLFSAIQKVRAKQDAAALARQTRVTGKIVGDHGPRDITPHQG